MLLSMNAPAHAQRHQSDQWVKLGEQDIGFGVDRETIQLGRDAGRFRAVTLKVLKHAVVIRRLRHEEHPATIFAAQALYSFIIASPGVMKLPQLPPIAWGGLMLAAIVVAIAQLEMTRAYQVMSVARGSSIQMLLPIVTGIGGFLCFGETFHTTEILGAMLTLLATWCVVAGK